MNIMCTTWSYKLPENLCRQTGGKQDKNNILAFSIKLKHST